MADSIPIKAGLKSRLGCLNCKKRKVKCDETKPSCVACDKRGDECTYPYSNSLRGLRYATSSKRPLLPATRRESSDFGPADALESHSSATPPTPSTTEPSNDGSGQQHGQQFDILDLELLQHWSTEVSFEMDEYSDTWFWQKLPETGLRHMPVMHLILAISARHLIRDEAHSMRDDLLPRAELHFSLAVNEFVQDLAQLESKDRQPVMRAATLFGFYYMSCGPVEGQYMAFADSTENSEGYKLMLGVKEIVTRVRPSNPHVPNGGREFILRSRDQPNAGFRLPLQTLLNAVDLADQNQDPAKELYVSAIHALNQVFDLRFSSESPKDRPIWSWLYIQPEEFMTALKTKRPVALILYAHFAVLIASVSDLWYIQGWPEHTMQGIYRHLPESYWPWLEWPAHAVQELLASMQPRHTPVDGMTT